MYYIVVSCVRGEQLKCKIIFACFFSLSLFCRRGLRCFWAHHSFLFTSCFSPCVFIPPYAQSSSTDYVVGLSAPAPHHYVWFTFTVYGTHVLVCKLCLIWHRVRPGDSFERQGDSPEWSFPHSPPSLYPLFPLHPSSQPNTRFSCHVEKKERKDQAFSYNPLQESSLIVFFFLPLFKIITAHTKSAKEDFWDVYSWIQMMYSLWQKGKRDEVEVKEYVGLFMVLLFRELAHNILIGLKDTPDLLLTFLFLKPI